MSYIQYYIEYIIKKHETLTTIPPIHVYINRINKRLVFKIKNGLFGSTKKKKKKIDKTKNGEKVPEVIEVVLVQYNLVDNQYQQKSEVSYTFTRNKFYAYLSSVEPSNSVFWKTYDTELDETIITFTDQNGRALEIEDKVNLIMLINK